MDALGLLIVFVSLMALGLWTLRRRETGVLEPYREFADSVTDACLLIRDGKIVHINNAGRELIYANPESLIGQDPMEVLSGIGARVDDRDEINRQLKERGHYRTVFKRLSPEGEPTYAEVTVVAFRSDASVRLTFMRDVTDSINTELYRQRDAQFNTAMSISGLASWTYDVKEDKQEWSPGMKDIFGITPDFEDQYLNDNDANVIHPADRDSVLNSLRQMADDQDPPPIRFRIIRPVDDELRHIEAHMGRLRDAQDQGDSLLIAICQDVTDRVEKEQQLRQAQKMEAMGELTGGVAHDFNNLLHVIQGNAELMPRPENERDRECLEMILAAAQRGAELTQQLLAYSRKQVLEQRSVNLNECLADMLPMLNRTLGESVEVETVFAPHISNAFLDQGLFENCVLNLIVNAQAAMPQGGVLKLETKPQTLNVQALKEMGVDDVEAGEFIRVTVSDTGKGIDDATAKRVFEPFFTTKEVGKGSGLGLSMVFGFIKQSRGHVVIDSEPGVGTAVHMWLPISIEDDVVTQDDGVQEPELEFNGRVLLVEDDREVANLTSTFLSIAGFEVSVADHGDAALRLMDEQNDFKLLLSDVVLPGGMTGVEVAERFRERFASGQVIFMSGYTRDAIRDYEMGPEDDYRLLSKPFTRAQLMDSVVHAIEMV
ncbi:MAG: PAS domain S-box protein [Pseudomonadota bacterium]